MEWVTGPGGVGDSNIGGGRNLRGKKEQVSVAGGNSLLFLACSLKKILENAEN